MPHFFNRDRADQDGSHGRRDPKNTQAYLVGSGIASLAAAVHLIEDAKVPPAQIHILESLPIPGGSLDGAGNADEGYILRGGRMLNFSYLCLYDLLQKIPSLTQKGKTVMDEIHEFNAKASNKTNAKARLLETTESGAKIVDVSDMGFSPADRMDLMTVILESEKSLCKKRIDECFHESFFKTNFWYMWATT